MSSGALVLSLSFKLAASSFLTMYLHSFQNNQFGLLSPFISVVPEGKKQCCCLSHSVLMYTRSGKLHQKKRF